MKANIESTSQRDRAMALIKKLRPETAQVISLNEPAAVQPKPRIRVKAGSSSSAVEIWRPIPNVSGNYACSNFGRFKNVRSGEVLKVRMVAKMMRVCFRDGDMLNLNAARTLAMVFCERKPGDEVIHFADHDRTNLRADNMSWIRLDDPRRHKSDLVNRATRNPVYNLRAA